MAIEVVDLPIQNGESFYSYGTHSQRVGLRHWLPHSFISPTHPTPPFDTSDITGVEPSLMVRTRIRETNPRDQPKASPGCVQRDVATVAMLREICDRRLWGR